MINNLKTAIIDIDSVMFSIGNPNKILDAYGIPVKKDGKFVTIEKTEEELADSCEFIMNKILTNSNCNDYIAFVKGNDTTKTKRLIDPNYKADRSTTSPQWWQFVRGYLVNNWGVIEAHGAEVDDFVNITRLQIPDSFMCCIDSDLLGLEGTHYNWKKNNLVGEWITTTAEQAEYKFWSDMICGTHNNTKGLPGKGIVYFKNFVLEHVELLGNSFHGATLNAYLTHFGEELGIEEFYKNYKMIKILNKFEEFVIPEPIKFKKNEELSEEKGIFD